MSQAPRRRRRVKRVVSLKRLACEHCARKFLGVDDLARHVREQHARSAALVAELRAIIQLHRIRTPVAIAYMREVDAGTPNAAWVPCAMNDPGARAFLCYE